MTVAWYALVPGPKPDNEGEARESGLEARETCIPNISPAERQKRLAAGLIQTFAGLAILGALIAFDVDRLWRIALLPIFWGAAVGFFQWRDKT